MINPLQIEPEQLGILPATTEDYELIYQDSDLVVVNKPTKLLTVPGRNPANHDCLVSRVQLKFPGAMVVHRLDYDTSGLVILPLNKPALSNISKQFQARTVHKHYTALVDSLIVQDTGTIDLAIAKDETNPRCYKICHTNGKASITDFEVLSRDVAKNQTRVLLKPITGRSHQLRLHLRAIGHVILGDEFYAPAEIFAAAPRLMLHSNHIEFQHPTQNILLSFDCPAPF